MINLSPHTFHIPVMGIAYTIDTPIKVASFGITSAISIVEDNLIEVMRKVYYKQNNEPYIPITNQEKDHRAKRVTDYLNLVNRMVKDRMEELRKASMEKGSDLVKYFDMLPDASDLKKRYLQFLSTAEPEDKKILENELRNNIQPGAIEVNIMTKVDREVNDRKGNPIPDGSDALTALKGYAKSNLDNSAVIFSAGMNPRLYNYLENFREFDAYDWGKFRKRIIIKVSDFRSALIQGKYLAKKGLWVSEFRIESGLNCGGHAFATQGSLMGPILEEFKNRKKELQDSLYELYNKSIEALGLKRFEKPHPIKITAQGGIGTYEEDQFLQNYYQVDSTGWGTPFLLCPEATTVDEDTLMVLQNSKDKDVVLSGSSPLGVSFNYLKGTSSEKERLKRIIQGKPGSSCPEKYLVSNTEFTKKPICTASKKYQNLKLAQLKASQLPEAEYEKQKSEVLEKECLCVGLSNSAPIQHEEEFVKNLKAVTICPGPNIANFNRKVSLEEITGHIYGRKSIMNRSERPNMFAKELTLYVDHLKKQVLEHISPDPRTKKSYQKFCNNLLEGMEYYKNLLVENYLSNSDQFRKILLNSEEEIYRLKEQLV
ncbi:hypothetical protein [Gramella sp. KN1008]|uniref:hypothetical protein n=1 Tax=Gramella sp. KN1008 TaxID=2529298 RepID=UPI001040771C|nr:hypothetical protein [Gramella sp. KN1008]TBW27474.1 hypothetical protein EZJ28_10905 [Gramella sp. KN1008]